MAELEITMCDLKMDRQVLICGSNLRFKFAVLISTRHV